MGLEGGGYELVVRQRVGIVVWVVIALGFTLGVLPRARPSRAALLTMIPAAGLVAFMALSLTWTESAERTTAELARLLTYLGVMVLAVSFLNRHTFRAAAAGLSAAAVLLTTLAVLSRVDPGGIAGADEVAEFFRTNRLSYGLDYWNAVGAWGAMTLAACLAWSGEARLIVTRALNLAAIPVAAVCIYLTYSRGAVAAAAIAVIAVLALSRNRWTVLANGMIAGIASAAVILVVRRHDEIVNGTGGAGGGEVFVAIIAAALVCAAAAWLTNWLSTDLWKLSPHRARIAVPIALGIGLIAATAVWGDQVSRLWDEFRGDQPVRQSASSDPASRIFTAGGARNEIWTSGLDAFSAHPWGGTGPGTFEFWYSRNGGEDVFLKDAHSLYVEVLAEVGLPGAILLVALLGAALFAAIQARSALARAGDLAASTAMIAVFVVFLWSAGIDWIWEVSAVGALALAGIAVAMAAASERRQRESRRGELGHRGIRAALVAIAAAAAIVQVPGLVATERISDSQAAARTGDLDRSQELAEEAIDAEPWAASPRAQLALVLEHQGRMQAARRAVRAAISREPTNWRYPLMLARIEVRSGDVAAARRTFRRGRRLAPNSLYYLSFETLAQGIPAGGCTTPRVGCLSFPGSGGQAIR